MPTFVESQPTVDQNKRTKQVASSRLARISAFKLGENLRAVILFSLLGLMISCALICLSGAAIPTQ
jgi:hypothetical protein